MTQAMITLRSNEAEMIALRVAAQSTETRTGWPFEMKLNAASREVAQAVDVGEAADVTLGKDHYQGAVLECDAVEGRVVVRGEGPAPVN